MKKFIGRGRQKKKFEESISQILSTPTKKSIFSKKGKKSNTGKVAPRLFLFYGEGGLGKTSLLEECVRIAEEKAKKNKEEIKIFKLDWDDCYNKKSILPDNISSIIKELYSLFSEALPEPEKYFSDFLEKDKEKNGGNEKHSEETEYELLEVLAKGVIELSKEYPLLFIVDAYERVDNKNVDRWFRGVFLKGIFETHGRIITILSGRNNHSEEYNSQFPGNFLHHTFFDDLLFTAAEIKEYAKACGLKFTDSDLNKMLRFTRGIPLVVVEVCSLINEGMNLNQVLGNLISLHNIRSIIQDVVKGFLKYCEPETRERVFHIAMQYHCNPEILANTWNIPVTETRSYLADLSERHSFINREKIHPQVYEYLRNYMINELVPKNPVIFKRFGKKCRDLLAPQLEEIQKKETTLEGLYSNENFLVSFFDYLNALMWWDTGEAITTINKYFLGLLEFKREVIPRLNKILFEFDPLLTPEQKKNVDTLVTGFLNNKFNGKDFTPAPGKSEIELLVALGNYKRTFTSIEVQLLYFKWAEIYFRSGEYEKAVKMLDISLDLIGKSNKIKIKIIQMLKIMAGRYFEMKQYSTAFDYLNRALRIDPEYTDVLWLRGNIFQAREEYDKAMADYNRIIELNPQEAKAFSSRGNTYAAGREFGKALNDYNQAIELGITGAETYFYRGIIHHAQGEHENALKDYNRALEIDPENALIYNSRGNIYFEQGEHEKALVDFSLAIELDLETAEVYITRGRIYQAGEEYDNALSDYHRALELNPQAWKVFCYRGDIYHALGEHKKALSDYEGAVELNPEYAAVEDSRGISYETKKEHEKELAEISLAIESDSQDAGLYHTRGNIYDSLEEYDRALTDFNRAIELDPQDADLFSSRGTIFHSRRKYKKALLDYSLAIDLEPEDASLYYNRGNTYDALEEYDNALSDYNRAIELDPDDTDANNNRGTIYFFKGEYRKAIADYNRAIELDSEDASIYYNRGNTYDALKEYNKALNDYKRAIELAPGQPTAYLVIAQLLIITNHFQAVLKIIEKTLRLTLDTDDRAYRLYFEYIARSMLDMDTSACEEKFDEILQEDFTSTWSHDEITSWLETAKIPADKKAAILEKTGLLKKHTNH
ncbi:MAG: tetratricopeptide repeat protein [Candidatus Aminicenantes bacterium]|nr:tetratricopeptide repeat protein [Candidatus Aminicenantes bacterium]